jgi:NAD(P)-dependent dehydrogenase (short-subunit alcohol dehydrogenase family)
MTAAIYEDETRVEAMIARTPLRRLGQPADAAAACLYLLSDQASFITGIDLVVDGGLLAKA